MSDALGIKKLNRNKRGGKRRLGQMKGGMSATKKSKNLGSTGRRLFRSSIGNAEEVLNYSSVVCMCVF